MNVTELITEVLITFAGVFFALLAGWLIIKAELFRNIHPVAVPSSNKKEGLLPLRLQANERIIVFVERINPVNLLIRLHQQGISVQELHSAILNEIRQEYQHNVGQQLYISKTVWNVVRKLKDDTIAMINNVVQHLPDNATGVDISKIVLQHMAIVDENPYDLTIDMLKADIHKLF